MQLKNIDKLSESGAQEYLLDLLSKLRQHCGEDKESAKGVLYNLIVGLDELDCEDFFGTEGWRRLLMGE